MAKKIWQKRRKALLQIAGTSGVNIVFAGAPKPGAEIPSHIALTGADFVMCGAIYMLYFEEKISTDRIRELLSDFGVLVVIAGGGGYAIAKGASGLIAEFTNFLGPLGMMASGLLAAGGTGALGLIWMALVDWTYRNQSSMAEAARAVA